jgi:hypothetical protein
MSSQVDIARALKDKDYFHSLTSEQQEMVRRNGGVGDAEITDDSLDSASGGLTGGARELNATGTDPQLDGGKSSAQVMTICNC